jgi:hypothetical protein
MVERHDGAHGVEASECAEVFDTMSEQVGIRWRARVDSKGV